MEPLRRIESHLTSLALALAFGAASAAAPCGVLLGGYLDASGDGGAVPCMVDLQENGLCFRLPGTTLDTTTRTLDAHLQAQGVPRPDWTTTDGANRTVVPAASGDRLEIVIAAEGPFTTSGTCRIFAER